jgi:hypothetical protein
VKSAPPHSPEGEQAVLGSILIRPELLPQIAGILKPSDFYREAHCRIYQAMLDLYQQGVPVDLVTVTQRLTKVGQLERVGGAVFLAGLSEQVGFAINGLHYAHLVREDSTIRNLIELGQQLFHDGLKAGASSKDLLLYAESRVHDLTSLNGSPKAVNLQQAVRTLDEFLDTKLPDRKIYLLPWLMEASIIMIYAARGTGKTMLAMALLTAITSGKAFGPWEIMEPVPCLYLDGEMVPQDTAQRLAGFRAGEQKKDFMVYSGALASQLGIPQANLLDEKWRSSMKDILLSQGVKVWVVDNIASLAPGIDENSKQDWDPINRFFIDLRFAGITTIFLHHESKDGKQRGTSGREDNLDFSIQLVKPSNYFREDGAKFIVKFQKARLRQADLHLIADTEFALETAEDGVYFWTYASVKKQAKKEVLKMLDAGMAAKDIALELELTRGRVSQIKSEAIKEGLLTEAGKLTQTGMVYVSRI